LIEPGGFLKVKG